MITNVIEECVNDVFLSVCVNRSKFKTVLIFLKLNMGKLMIMKQGICYNLYYILLFLYIKE